jgi:EAL domain-containing protein (putative c-di-GMP-specific phosphodiesterase class I)/GGDEF domain-containing protein
MDNVRLSPAAGGDAAENALRDTTTALERLLGGDVGVQLPCSGDVDATRLATAFNALSAEIENLRRGGLLRPGASQEPGLQSPGDHVPSYVAVLGLQGFSRLRQHIGSEIADGVLRACARRVLDCMPTAQLGRIGRTNLEFGFHAANIAEAEAMLQALQKVCERRLAFGGQNFDLGVAIGLADRETCGDAVIECAAVALAQAQGGGGKVVAYREADRIDAAARLQLLGDLRQAMESDQLFLAYQPKLRTRTDGVDVAEALLRWTHPERGPVPPDDFIGLAEETGLIGDLTRWVLNRAIADQARLAQAGHELAIHINLSGRLVADPDFTRWLVDTVVRDAVGVIGLEITETAVIDDPEAALANLQAFADAGLKIAIDDYGSGLSSLAYLKQLPAHELKIDRMFISGLTSSHRDPLLVRSTIDLAHALGMEVTAEGVDSPIALALLRMMGCDLIQGYLISPPLDLPALQAFLSAGVQLQVAPIPNFKSRIS